MDIERRQMLYDFFNATRENMERGSWALSLAYSVPEDMVSTVQEEFQRSDKGKV